jgi:hypothetical protein
MMRRGMSPDGTEGDLRPSGNHGRNRRDFCRGSRLGNTRSIDPKRSLGSIHWIFLGLSH